MPLKIVVLAPGAKICHAVHVLAKAANSDLESALKAYISVVYTAVFVQRLAIFTTQIENIGEVPCHFHHFSEVLFRKVFQFGRGIDEAFKQGLIFDDVAGAWKYFLVQEYINNQPSLICIFYRRQYFAGFVVRVADIKLPVPVDFVSGGFRGHHLESRLIHADNAFSQLDFKGRI